MIWSDFGNFTAAQQTKAAQFETIGRALALYRQGKGPLPDLTPVNNSNCKAARAKFDDLTALVEPAMIGVNYAYTVFRQQAADSFDTANP